MHLCPLNYHKIIVIQAFIRRSQKVGGPMISYQSKFNFKLITLYSIQYVHLKSQTSKTVKVLKRCRRVFFLIPTLFTLRSIQSYTRKFLRVFNV